LLYGNPNDEISSIEDGLDIHFTKYNLYCVITLRGETAVAFREMDANVVHIVRNVQFRDVDATYYILIYHNLFYNY